jgi:hypothetical protein
LKESRSELDFARVARVPVPFFAEKEEALGHEALTTLLTQLRPREFWVKRRGPYPPVQQRALYMPEPHLSRELFQARQQLVDTSGRRFGKLKTVVREELAYGRSDPGGAATTYYEKI